VAAVVALAATTLSDGPDVTGGVLSVTATPAAGSAAPVGAPSPGAAGSLAPSGPGASPAASAAASPAASAAASPAASAAASLRPGPSAAAQASPPVPEIPSPGRLALLRACPGRLDCYLYVVRTGDTLSRIATFFGVPADTILRLNPAITDPSIVVRGSTIVIPTPTR